MENSSTTGIEKLFEKEIKENKPFVDAFCKKYNVKLKRILPVSKNNLPESMHYFSDNLGGYTIKGIENSLGKALVQKIEKDFEEGKYSKRI